MLNQSFINTPIGSMIVIANNDALCFLNFVDAKGVDREIERLQQQTKSTITQGVSMPIVSIEQELNAWFEGTLKSFKTPWILSGSLFQNDVWNALCRIPYGETRSYLEEATMIGRPSAYRAVANANGANPLAIIIPCHRVIHNNGGLGGYGGGLSRKQWLLEHEKNRLGG